jgi:hypothetical protein
MGRGRRAAAAWARAARVMMPAQVMQRMRMMVSMGIMRF